MTDETTNNAPAAGTLAADPGFAKLDESLRGAFANKGWDKKPALEAAAEAMRSYAEVEKHLGIPRDQLLRLPKDAADKDGWTAFNAKIGVPEKPESYDIANVKFKDGSDLDESFANAIKTAMHAEGVPARSAAGLVSSIVKYMEGVEETEASQTQAKLAEGRDALAKSWGANAEANKFIAGQAVKKLGLPEDFVSQVEKIAGYESTMQMLLKLGVAMGEDKMVANNNGGQRDIYTREQASARLDELKRDAAWVAKVNSGDSKANEEFNALTRIVALGRAA